MILKTKKTLLCLLGCLKKSMADFSEISWTDSFWDKEDVAFGTLFEIFYR